MEPKNKIGILKYIASTGAKGVKFEDESEIWYNPANDAAKAMINNDYIGKQVEIILVKGKKTEFSSMLLLGVDVEEEDSEQLGETEAGVPTGPSHVEEKKQTDETSCVEVVTEMPEQIIGVLNKLCKIQQELKVPKSQRNEFAKFNFRSMTDILEGIKPLLKKYNVCIVITDFMKLIGDRIYVEATARIYDNNTGYFIESKGFAREAKEKKGMDEAQITGSASSYARKYALNGLLAIDDTKDIDSQ